MAIKGFYGLTEKIKTLLESNDHVNTVTYGNLFEVATEKNTIYPLSHFVVNNVDIEEGYYRFSISLLCMDLIDQVKDYPDDMFYGGDNIQDIFHTQLTVVKNLINSLTQADIRDEGYVLEGTPNVEAFKHRFKDDVAGWTLTFDVLVRNDLSIC